MLFGGDGENRTRDDYVMSVAFYQLNYVTMAGVHGFEPWQLESKSSALPIKLYPNRLFLAEVVGLEPTRTISSAWVKTRCV
jgi:hypothetical protein